MLEAARVVLAVGITHFAKKPELVDGLAGRVAQFRSFRTGALQGSGRAGAGRWVFGRRYRGACWPMPAPKSGCWRARRRFTITPCPILRRPTGCAPSPIPPAASARAGAVSSAAMRRACSAACRSICAWKPPAGIWVRRRAGSCAASWTGGCPPCWAMTSKRPNMPRTGCSSPRGAMMATRWRCRAGHVIAATGYRPDLRRLPFLDAALRTLHRPCAADAKIVRQFRKLGAGPLYGGPDRRQHLRAADALHGGLRICRSARLRPSGGDAHTGQPQPRSADSRPHSARCESFAPAPSTKAWGAFRES